MARPGTPTYWRKHREEIWALHGEGLSAAEIVERGVYPLACVRMALASLRDEVRKRRAIVDAADHAMIRREMERERLARAAAQAMRKAKAAAEAKARAEARMVLAETRRKKMAKPRLTIEDRIAIHWSRGNDTFDIAWMMRRDEAFVVKALVARREAARRRALRGAA